MRVRLCQDQDSFGELSRKMGHMFDELHSRSFHQFSSTGVWSPAVNVYEGSEAFVVCVDLAGMDRDHIEVFAERNGLVIRGTRPTPEPDKTPGPFSLHLMEIDSGRFHRKVEFPSGVDNAGIKATYRHGLLWVVLPKRDH